MKALLGFLVFTALTGVVPIYGTFIYDRFKEGQWKRGVKHSTVALVLVFVIFLLGYYGWSAQTAKDAKKMPELQYLNKQNFAEEVAYRRQQNALSAPNLDQHLQVIKAKFDEAEYAQEKHDFDRALQLYTEIERGSDQNGTFTQIQSACIENNMAIDLFRTQGDKRFRASSLLFTALGITPKPQYQTDAIQRNIEMLDHYINE